MAIHKYLISVIFFQTFMEKTKVFMERIVKRVGFLGILACASVRFYQYFSWKFSFFGIVDCINLCLQIPNPLFDLAGITCGHFLIPFWTFFGATLLGKAVIKMTIQVLFVIIAFNEVLIDTVLSYVSFVPVIGTNLQPMLSQFLKNQKQRLHDKEGNAPAVSYHLSGYLINSVLYFTLSNTCLISGSE